MSEFHKGGEAVTLKRIFTDYYKLEEVGTLRWTKY